MCSQAFENIKDFVHINTIDMTEVHCIKNIKMLHQSLIREMSGDKFKDASPPSHNIENKLLKQFGDEFCIIKGSIRQGNIIFSKTLLISITITTKSQDFQLRDAALILCKIILSSESKPFP